MEFSEKLRASGRGDIWRRGAGGGGHSLGDVVTRVNGLEKGQCRAILENEAAEWTPALPGWCPHGTPGAHELGKRLLDSNLWEKRPFILQIT